MISSGEQDARVAPSNRDALIERITAHLPEDGGTLVDFARAFLRRVPTDFAGRVGDEELAARVVGLHRFVAERDPGEPEVRVFDPASEDGYGAEGSVVEISVDDSPFLIDSVTAEILARGLGLEATLHPVIGTSRDEAGRLRAVRYAREAERRESVQHYELDRVLSSEEAADLEMALRNVLTDVREVVADFEPMRNAVIEMIELTHRGTPRYSASDIAEAEALLRWLLFDNFVFLGYRRYDITDTPEGRMISVAPGSGLGLLRDVAQSAYAEPTPMASLPADLRARYEEGFLLVVSKTNHDSTVHRRAKMDYVGVRIIGDDGSVVGEARLIGLFTSRAYMSESAAMPLLRQKLEAILEAEDLIEGSHDHKAAVQLFNSFPKDELFTTPTEDIRASVVGLLTAEEHGRVRLFVRPDFLQRSVSLMVAMPRDRFNPELRRRLQALFKERYGGSSVDYRLSLGETDHARIHFTLWVEGGEIPEVAVEELEQEVLELCRTWEDRIAGVLRASMPAEAAEGLALRWAPHLPSYYKSSTDLAVAAGDIANLARLSEGDRRLGVGLQNDVGSGEELTRLAVYHRDGKLDLSALLPVLEALGLRVVEEIPTRLRGLADEWFIHDFGVLGPDDRPLAIDTCGGRLVGAAEAVLLGEAESDSLDRLIVVSDLDHAQVAVLRAYRTYWRRVSPAFTSTYINDAFVEHPGIAAKLVRLFEARFDPDGSGADEDELRQEILEHLDAVKSIDEDRILRAFLDMILATVRTNAYRDGRSSLALKLRSANVPDVPEPVPLYEIFVYARDVEGVHLRAGSIARGGIRWSDRREDYRSEVLGLMKAQVTKNAIIVPTGAKGGFVVRRMPAGGDVASAVRAAYETFIRGLLDVTDNVVAGTVVHPDGVRVHDAEDPYLVVAADRGTATFSDAANALAAEYGFWLGDAFASGGSTGYDHKALGITARGGWESVKRHFLDLGVDVTTEPIATVGIGDMSGDVFGNGMLQSPQIRLIAAFDHRHIFIDPDPDPDVAYGERQRLYDLPRSSWADYDAGLLSEGGGVYARTEKRIELSHQARFALGVEADALAPHEVIRAILRAPVDLLWNGGIGTYVKASTESHLDCADRSNDTVRVDGSELRCRVVGEGGNLGFTQRGRIEFALAGGHINTDFVDNSGGVDCSDREVNLKVLLRLAEERGELQPDERNALIAGVAEGVTARVLYDNYLQAQILSQEVVAAGTQPEAYEDLMAVLEVEGGLDRALEHLPTTDQLAERSRDGGGLTRPELGVLMAYTKRHLRERLLASELPDWEEHLDDLAEYFPEPVVERFGERLGDHALRREIIATVVANQVVNSQGIIFVNRLMAQTGSSAATVVRAYRIARELVGATRRWRAIEELDGAVDPGLQAELMAGVDSLVEAIARWYLGRPALETMAEAIAAARPGFGELQSSIGDVGPSDWRAERDRRVSTLVASGVPEDVARRHVYQVELMHGPDILELAHQSDRPVVEVARIFFLVGELYDIDWLEDRAAALRAETRWQRWAVEALEDDLLLLRRQLVARVLADAGELTAAQAVRAYREGRPEGHERLAEFMVRLKREGADDLASLVVAVRQTRVLAG